MVGDVGYQNCSTLAVDVISFDVFIPQKCSHPGVGIGLKRDISIELRGIFYLCLVPTKDPSRPVGNPTMTFRIAVERRTGKRSYKDFRSVRRVELLVELIPGICSCVELCYL